MTEYPQLTIRNLLNGLAAGRFSAKEIADAALQQLDRSQHLNVAVARTEELAFAQADACQQRLSQHSPRALESIPIAHKDMFCVKNQPCSAASKILQSFVPHYDATVVDKLQQQGTLTVAILNCDEFAMGSTSTTSFYGPVVNPYQGNLKQPLVAGGSSGGSAAAVAAGIVPIATGTDTGGSIRQPASFCGVVGFKPSYGRCSRFGIVAFASSLDQAGIFARSVYDAALAVQIMSGPDPRDMLTVNRHDLNFTQTLGQSIRGLRIGIPAQYYADSLNPEIAGLWKQAAAWFENHGAIIINDISLEHTQYALPAYYVICTAEASSNLARYDGVRYGFRAQHFDDLEDLYAQTRGQGFGNEVKRRILIGTYVLSVGHYDAYYKKAQQVRRCIANDFNQAFQSCDLLLTPTTPTTAFSIENAPDDPITMYLNDVFTVPTSLAGLPAISVPCGLSSENLPIGLQLIGKQMDEATLLSAASVLEACAQFSPPSS